MLSTSQVHHAVHKSSLVIVDGSFSATLQVYVPAVQVFLLFPQMIILTSSLKHSSHCSGLSFF